jgi:hypothetical protein
VYELELFLSLGAESSAWPPSLTTSRSASSRSRQLSTTRTITDVRFDAWVAENDRAVESLTPSGELVSVHHAAKRHQAGRKEHSGDRGGDWTSQTAGV